MKSNHQTLQNSLRCLQHPLSLASIAILLFNDHVLKIISPSWLTGKLSDFAGLFFFPFVMAAFLGLALSRTRLTSRQIGWMAFGLVALWFTLLKLFQPVNSLTSEFASVMVGFRVHFIPDWTDLLAMAVLLPAWGLWRQDFRLRSPGRGYLVLSIGILAAIASSPREWTVTSVTDLAFSGDGIVYAADRETFGTTPYPVAVSMDGGQTWELSQESNVPPGIEDKTYAVQVCHDLNQFRKTCYRVTSNHEFEFLNTDWMSVFPSNGLLVQAYDVILIEWEGKQYMLVAIGESGILRRELPRGNWEIIPICNAESW